MYLRVSICFSFVNIINSLLDFGDNNIWKVERHSYHTKPILILLFPNIISIISNAEI